MKLRLQIAVVLLGVFATLQTSALPRFAARTGARCQSCHVNPSGGGMRQTFGVQYGRETLPVPTWSEEFGLDDFSTALTNFVSVGADFRTLFFVQESGQTSTNALYQMQGNVYLNFKVAKKFNMYLSKGLYNGFEIFGLLNVLPENGHIKVGKFMPNYGMKVDDHRVFTRDKTGFSPENSRAELVGGEAGITPGPISITAGVYNSDDAGDRPTGNKNKAFLGRAEGIFKLSEDMHLAIGGSVFSRKSAAGKRTTLMGGFGSFSVGDLTVLGAADFIRNSGVGTTKDSTSLATFVEVDYVLTPGLDLKLIYDFYDMDKDVKTGAMSRYSVGVEFFPLSGVEVRPVYRISKEQPVETKNNEFNLLIHFYL